MSETLAERARRKAAEAGHSVAPAPTAKMTFDADLIPDAGKPTGRPEEAELDTLLNGVDIIDAYNRWCGKMVPNPGSKRESIKVSCPNPAHPDKDPSAWINLDEQVYHCGGCEQGGDKYDIAAYRFGYPVPGYKSKEMFPKLRREMAEDLGYVVIKSATGADRAVIAEPEPDVAPADTDDAVATLHALPSAGDEEYDELVKEVPEIAWQDMLRPDTFLWKWMNVTTKYDYPDEYMFWLGMQALAAACGDDLVLLDQPPIEPNLFLCLYGPSGIGKSRAVRLLTELLKVALPYHEDDPNSKGTFLAPTPASGEALIRIFSKIERDPADPKVILGHRQVRGLIRFDELASLTSKSGRSGSTLKPTIMSLYDGDAVSNVSMGMGTMKTENPFCMMISTTQPKAIRELLAQHDADSGFINRWVFVAGKPKKLIAYGREQFDPELLKMPLQRVHSWASFGRRMVLEGEALEVWKEFFETEIEPLKVEEDGNPMLSRAELTIMKCITLLTANEMRSLNPTEEHVRAGISLWPYLRHTYQMLAGEIGLGIVDACANDILRGITDITAKLGRPPTARELFERKLRRRYSRKTVLDSLQQLVAVGEVAEAVVKTKTGPATVRYVVAAASSA